MAYPSFYDADRVGALYTPDAFTATVAGRQAGLSPATDDQDRTMLLLIDMQVDFIHPEGSLSVPGAVDDTRRLIEWLFDHMGQVTHIAASLDSHVPIQIFSPSWWQDEHGASPQPYTVITSEDVTTKRWQPIYEPDWSIDYVRQLEEQARKQLMIWPYHTLIGTPGHNFMPALYEALAYHSAARQAQPHLAVKGSIPRSEYYSLLEPEVKVPDHPQGTLNTAFLDDMGGYDRVYVAGQAKSHCVLETLASITRYFADQPDTLSRFYVLTDCMSSVAHPEIDFDALADEAFARFESQGVNMIQTR